MPNMIRTARGEMVDFDAIIIKQALAEAPMNIEVAQRKRFIDSKEEKPKRMAHVAEHNATGQPVITVIVPTDEEIDAANARKDSDFEPEAAGQSVIPTGPLDGPVPELPIRAKK
jgi:hypothetical protein